MSSTEDMINKFEMCARFVYSMPMDTTLSSLSQL